MKILKRGYKGRCVVGVHELRFGQEEQCPVTSGVTLWIPRYGRRLLGYDFHLSLILLGSCSETTRKPPVCSTKLNAIVQ